MNRSEILSVIREELAVAAPDVPADAGTADHFGQELEVDSLAVLEFVARLEYRFGIAVPDDAWPGLTSMDAVADFLEAALVGAS
jgi:acyl carrier protein